MIHSKPKALGTYFFSDNKQNIDLMINHTSSGGTTINEVFAHMEHRALPFGGANTSGEGYENGYYGFLSFSHKRSILRKPGKNAMMAFNSKLPGEVKKTFDKMINMLKFLN